MEHSSLRALILSIRTLLNVTSHLVRIKLPFPRLLSLAIWEFVGLVIIGATAFVTCLGLLYIGKSLWFIYSQTLIGQEYLKHTTEQYQLIDDFYNRDLISVSLGINYTIASYGIPISILSQCTYINTILYYPRGIFGKAILWIFPFTAGITHIIAKSYAYELEWSSLIFFTILPTAILFNQFMESAARMIPHGLLVNVLFTWMWRVGYLGLGLLSTRRNEKGARAGGQVVQNRNHGHGSK